MQFKILTLFWKFCKDKKLLYFLTFLAFIFNSWFVKLALWYM